MIQSNKAKYYNIQFITSPSEKYTELETIEECCKAGIKWIQLRMKDTEESEFEKNAVKAQQICKNYNSIFIINDNVALAKRISADGVHIGKNDLNPLKAREILGNKFIIGGTANTFEDITSLNESGVNYIGLGPFRFTETKENLSPVLGLNGYKRIVEQCLRKNIDIPIYAIGGIKSNDFMALKATGIHGIAVSSAISNARNIKEKVKEFLKEV